MKRYLLFGIVILVYSNISKAQSWQFAKHIGSNYQFYNEFVNNIFYNSNSVYLIGNYGGTLYFSNDSLEAGGWNDIFILKLDGSGNKIWSRTVGSASISPSFLESGYGSFDNANQCLYLSGKIKGIVDFGNGVILNTISSNEDAFLAKFDSSGTCQWAKLIYSSGKDMAYCFVQPDGNILLAGKLGDNGFVDAISITAGGFLARFDPSGNIIWAENKFIGPEKYPFHAKFIGSDIILAGVFDTITATIDTCQLQLTGSRNAFLTRLDSIGQVKWIHSFEGGGSNNIGNIVIDDFDNIIATGGFQDSIKLGSITLYDNGPDFFISKFNSNGNTIWTKQINCNGNYAAGADVCLDGDGNYYVTGLFNGNASFGSFNISTSNQYDMFISKYNSVGDCIGVINFGQAIGEGVTIDNLNNVICAGTFSNTVNIGSTSITAFNSQDIFLAKLDEITGIEESKISDNILHIYANPSNGSCTIDIPDVMLNKRLLQIEVFNSEGKIILSEQIDVHSEKYILNISSEPKGLYSVYLSDGKFKYSGKIVFN